MNKVKLNGQFEFVRYFLIIKISSFFFTGKLLSRSHKIAYALLNRIGFKPTEVNVKPGDRVALVYPNNDPLNFICAFYGCVMAGVVPVPIEVPITRRVSEIFLSLSKRQMNKKDLKT
jgi:acyl-CoA synthetase (AMP-forming)/AMP-acid ligase II